MEQGTFTYANPPLIHWGAGCVAQRLDAELERLAARRVFLVTGRSVGAHPALAGALKEQLGNRLAGHYAGIGEHAPAETVDEAADAARAAESDVLLSLGGGSPIDAAKAIAFILATGLDIADSKAPAAAQALALTGKRVLPHIAIPTTLSTAELAGSAGFSTVGRREKVGLRAPELVPAVVFYDAALAVHTPLPLWLSTGIRAVDHAVEGIVAPGQHPLSDTLALEGLRRLAESLRASHADPTNLESRTQSQLGAWFSYTLPGPSAAGLSHTLGKRLGARHGIPHGVTSCLLLPHVMRYLAPRTRAAQARIAAALGEQTRGPSGEEAATAADAVYRLIADLGLPQHMAAYRLSEEDLVEAARAVASDVYPLDDLLAIYHAAW